MGSWVTLSALGEPFAVLLEGVSDQDARDFVSSWEWCGARFVDGAPDGVAVIRGTVVAPVARDVDGNQVGEREAGIRRLGAHGDDDDVPELHDLPEVPESHRMRAGSYRALADHLSGLITRLAIGARRTELLMFHAGGVADPATGNVIAFIGPSGRGKTTASIALGQVFEYVTDETLAVGDDLAVLAYGKPLSVKKPAPEAWKDQVSPTALGLRRPGGEPLHLVGVVMLDRQPEYALGQKPSIRSVGVAESAEELVPQISYLPERPRPLQRLVEVLAACGGLRAVTYREAATLPEVFGELFAAAASSSAAASRAAGAARVALLGLAGEVGEPAADTDEAGEVEYSVVLSDDAGMMDARQQSSGEHFQAAHTDAVRDGSELIVLSGTMVRVLSGIAPTIIEATREPRTLPELVDVVLDAHGDPGEGEAERLVAAAVDELKDIGLLGVVGR